MGNATRMLADGFIRMVRELESSNILDEMARKAGVDIATNPYQVLTNHLKRSAVISGSNQIIIEFVICKKESETKIQVSAKVAKTTDLVPRRRSNNSQYGISSPRIKNVC